MVSRITGKVDFGRFHLSSLRYRDERQTWELTRRTIRRMSRSGNIDWWDSGHRNRTTVACIFLVGLAFISLVFLPDGWVGSILNLFIGGMLVYLSVHPDAKFYEGGLTTRQRRGPELHPKIIYRILFFVGGSLLICGTFLGILRHKS